MRPSVSIPFFDCSLCSKSLSAKSTVHGSLCRFRAIHAVHDGCRRRWVLFQRSPLQECFSFEQSQGRVYEMGDFRLRLGRAIFSINEQLRGINLEVGTGSFFFDGTKFVGGFAGGNIGTNGLFMPTGRADGLRFLNRTISERVCPVCRCMSGPSGVNDPPYQVCMYWVHPPMLL